MRNKATIGVVTAALLAGLSGAAQAQAPDWDEAFRPAQMQTVQQKRVQTVQQKKRAPTRIIVRPVVRDRQGATEFPRADNPGFPGRNAVRQCTSWLATEYRPSGTVVTPQMRCWWQRG